MPHLSQLLPELWEQLDPNERELLLLRADLRSCPAGRQIYPLPPDVVGEPTIVTVVQGLALTCYSREGEEAVPLYFTDREMMGLTKPLTGLEDRHLCRALTDCCLVILPLELMEQILSANAAAAKLLLGQTLRQLTLAERRQVSQSGRHMPGRMAATLLYLDRAYGRLEDGRTLSLALSRALLGALSGMTTGNATRVLRSFEHDGILALEGRRIEILRAEALEEISRHG